MISTKQDGRPSFQFYPKDWMTDTGLRISSFAARGLWLEILCLMFFSKKRGSLALPEKYKTDTKLHTKPYTKSYTKFLSDILGQPESEIEPLLGELIINKVVDFNEELMICRRMYYENELSIIRKEAIKKRWLKNDTKNDTKKIQTGEEEEEEEVFSNTNNAIKTNKDKNKRIKELVDWYYVKYIEILNEPNVENELKATPVITGQHAIVCQRLLRHYNFEIIKEAIIGFLKDKSDPWLKKRGWHISELEKWLPAKALKIQEQLKIQRTRTENETDQAGHHKEEGIKHGQRE